MRLVAAIAAILLAAEPARAERTIGVFAGAARTQSATISIVQPAAGTDVSLAPVHYRGESFTPPLYYGARLGWFARRSSWLGFESEFIHLKAFAETEKRTHASGRLRGAVIDDDSMPVGAIVERLSVSHGLNLLLFNAVARRGVGGRDQPDRVALIGRAGIGPTIPHAESSIEGVSREGYAWGAFAFQAAGGIEVRTTRGLAVVAEYKFTRTRQSLEIDRGEARGVFASHHGIVGLAWHF